MAVNMKAAAGFVVGGLALGTGISLFTGPRMDEIREERAPRDEWVSAANKHFAGASEGGVTPEEMREAAAYIRDNDMPEGIDSNIGNDSIRFSRSYDDGSSRLAHLAAGPAFAIVGGGTLTVVGGVLALLDGGSARGAGLGLAVAATGAALLGSYFGAEMLRT